MCARVCRRSAWFLVLGALIAAAVLSGGGVAVADHNFSDVPDSAFYHDFVDFLVNNGITGGCSVAPPLYCGEEPVTRGQVAVFLERTAETVRPARIDRPFRVFVVCAATNRFAVVSAAAAFVRDQPERRRPSWTSVHTRSASTSTCRAARGRSRSARRAAAARRPAWATSPDGRAT